MALESTPANLISLQAKLSRRYVEASLDRGHSPVLIGNYTLDTVTGLGIIDGTNLGAQIRRAIDEYVDRRVQDPTLPDQIAAAKVNKYETVRAVEQASDTQQSGHVNLAVIEALSLDLRVLHLAACALCQAEVTGYIEELDEQQNVPE